MMSVRRSPTQVVCVEHGSREKVGIPVNQYLIVSPVIHGTALHGLLVLPQEDFAGGDS